MEGMSYMHRISLHEFRLAPHFENAYQILIMLRGRTNYTIEDNDYELKRGSIVVLNTMENHTLDVLEYPYERIIMRLEPSYFFDEIREPELMGIFINRTSNFRHVLTVTDEAWDSIMTSCSLIEKEYAGIDRFSPLVLGSEIRKLFVNLYRGSAMDDSSSSGGALRVVSAAMNYMNKHFTENITIDDIAAAAMKSRDHLSHLFTRTAGISIKQYLINLRINHAKFLLSETDRNISEIAEECGYGELNFFSRQFRNSEKISPSEFRRMIRKNHVEDTD